MMGIYGDHGGGKEYEKSLMSWDDYLLSYSRKLFKKDIYGSFQRIPKNMMRHSPKPDTVNLASRIEHPLDI